VFPAGDLLSSAFASLDESDKYDAVLTGLCAKILDTGGASKVSEASTTGEESSVLGDEYVQSAVSPLGVMEQPLKLLQEMNARRVRASPRSVSALIDVSDRFAIFDLRIFPNSRLFELNLVDVFYYAIYNFTLSLSLSLSLALSVLLVIFT